MHPSSFKMTLSCFLVLTIVATLISQGLDSSDYEIQFEETPSEEQVLKINERSIENDLSEFRMNPIDLNEASLEDIQRFPLWNASESLKIADYILRHRPILSVLELQSIEGIPLELIRFSLPYLTIGKVAAKLPLWKSITSKGHHSIIMRWGKPLQKDPIYNRNDTLPNAFHGSADKVYFRFKSAIPSKYALGFSMEKDPGEAWFCSKYIKTIDFISGHLMLENIYKTMSSIIIGDYVLRLGQGLIIDNGFSAGKTTSFGSVAKSTSIIKPYQSVGESDMLRGIATNFKLSKEMAILFFYSKVKHDAKLVQELNPITGILENRISSIQNSGYHRTTTELKDQKTFEIQHGGWSLDYRSKAYKIGLNGVWTHQDKLANTVKRMDQIFHFSEKNNLTGSIHHQFKLKNLNLIGELAMSSKAQYAMIEHLLIGLGKGAEAIVSYRNFQAGFHQLLSNTISSNSTSTNEKAVYFAMNIYPLSKVILHGRAEFIDFPWLKYQTDLLSSRQSYLIKIQFMERRKWSSYIQFRRQIEDFTTPDQIIFKEKKAALQITQQLRIHLESKLKNSLIWRSRIEFSWVKTDEEFAKGFVLLQDLLFKTNESKISSNIRFAIFDISHYDARIYAFENDVLSQYSLSSYNGRGIRVYTNIRYRPFRAITVDFRVASSYFFKENNPPNTEAEIPSAYHSEIKFQLRFQF